MSVNEAIEILIYRIDFTNNLFYYDKADICEVILIQRAINVLQDKNAIQLFNNAIEKRRQENEITRKS